MPANLTLSHFKSEAARFSEMESHHEEPTLFGVTDGKAIGTYLEHKFTAHLKIKYGFDAGNSASGIDFPGIGVDMKVTSFRQPQSSSPFKSARQKIFGLGYHLLVFVYEKADNEVKRTGRLFINNTIFIDNERTADYQMTRGIISLLSNEANIDDLVAFMEDKNLPVDDIEARNIAKEILQQPPKLGYLTISNALQWRLQYGRAIQRAGEVSGIERVR